MKPKPYEVVVGYDYCKVYINGLLHISFRLEKFVGLQSWLDRGKNRYYIEYTFSDDGAILTEYDTKELWEGILDELNTKDLYL